MKKLIAILLAALMLLSFSGCQKKKEASGEIPTLLWYVHGDSQSDVKSVMEEVNKITAEKIGVKVDLQFIDQAAYSERMQMIMAANTEFDLCFTGYVNKYDAAVKRGGFVKLDEMLEKTPELKKIIPDYLWETTTYDGGIYAVPNLQIVSQQLNMFTFKDLADKYDLDGLDIKTIMDCEPYMEKIKQNEPDYYPFRANMGTSPFMDGDYGENIQSQAMIFYNEDGKVSQINYQGFMDEYYEAAERIRDWYEKGYIRQDIASVTDDSQDHNSCKYAVWIEKYKPGILDELKIKFGREVVTKQIMPNLFKSTAPDAMTAISRTSKHPEKALELIQLVNTDKELYNLICYGIEGKHYKLDENGRVVYIEESGYAPKACWKFGNQFNALLLPGQPDDVWEQTAKMNEEAIKSPAIGFKFNNDPVRNEISQVTSILSEYVIIGKGAEEPSVYFDDMIKRVKDAGIEKIVDELKKQYSEWEKTK